MMVWMVALMYRGFATSCIVRGARSTVAFIIAVVASEIMSELMITRFII